MSLSVNSIIESLVHERYFGYNPKEFQFEPKAFGNSNDLHRRQKRRRFQAPRTRRKFVPGMFEGDYDTRTLIADSGAAQIYTPYYEKTETRYVNNRMSSFIIEKSVPLDIDHSNWGRDVQHVKCVSPVNGPWQVKPAPFRFHKRTREYNLAVCTSDNWVDSLSLTGYFGQSYFGYASILETNLMAARNGMITDLFSSGFEILPFAADLDSTVETMFKTVPRTVELSKLKLHQKRVGANGQLDKSLFTGNEERLAREAYAELSWGWLPLIRDLPKMLKAFNMQMENVKRFGGENNASKIKCQTTLSPHPSNTAGNNPYFVSGVSGKARLNGYLTSEFGMGWNNATLKQLMLAADAIGFHPDLSTAWEIFPASFIVDGFIPVGQFLDEVHPRGWFKKGQTFTGWFSGKGSFSANYRYDYFTNFGQRVVTHVPQGSSHDFYIRKYFREFPVANWDKPSLKDIEWKAPRALDVFNAVVVARLWRD